MPHKRHPSREAERDDASLLKHFKGAPSEAVGSGDIQSAITASFCTDPSVPIFVEACAGCGILSATAKEQGFQVVQIDNERNRHRPQCRILTMDLTSEFADATLRWLCSNFNVVAVHIALPCGTCSKARGIPMADGAPGPQPLRSSTHLHGLPGLPPWDQVKVQAANALYAWASQFVLFLDTIGTPWTIENPSNSWLWDLPEMEPLMAMGHIYHLHPCAYGGTRKKDTAFLCSCADFASLERFCDGSHEHEAWGYDAEAGMFNTAKEAEYPKELCRQYVHILTDLCAGANVSHSAASTSSHFKAFKQAKGRGVPQIVSEFRAVVSQLLDTSPTIDDKRKLTSSIFDIPVGSKLLRTEAKWGKLMCVFGIYRTAEEFLQVSRSLWHPYDELINLPHDLVLCIFHSLLIGPLEMTKARIRTVKLWNTWASELAQDEAALHQRMDPGVRQCLQGKRLLLLEKIAASVNWPDMRLFEEIRSGFLLTGKALPSGVFRTELKLGSFDKTKLMKDAKFLKPALLGKIKAGGLSEDSQALYDITVDEAVSKKWLEGPYTPTEISVKVGEPWLPVRRFALHQKGKLRPIDDFKENRLNEAFSSSERIDLHAVDHLVWSAMMVLNCSLHRRDMHFKLDDGTELSGPVHSGWSHAKEDLLITAFDLESAYKQLPLNPQERDCTVVSLANPKDGSPACFIMNTLPFGSVASVLHFNRVARLIWRIGLELNVWWTNYFDDYPCLTCALQTKSTMAAVKSLFSTLGFKFAADKLSDFGPEAEVLGVKIAVQCPAKVVVANKESRLADTLNMLEEVIATKQVVPADIPSVLGRLQFVGMHLAGRSGKLAMADIREIGTQSKVPITVPEEVLDAFCVLKTRLCNGKPKVLESGQLQRPILIFTDGALEPSGNDAPTATIGGVCVCPDDGRIEVFGCHVAPEILDVWLLDGPHPIGLVELYGVAVAYKLWFHLISGRRVIFFGDNWGAIDCYVKGSSTKKPWRNILLEIEKIDMHGEALCWMARVPSESNVADPPSRGDLAAIEFLKPFEVVSACCPFSGSKLKPCLS